MARARNNPHYALVDEDSPGTVLVLQATNSKDAVAEAHRRAKGHKVVRFKVVLLNPEYAAALAANNPPAIMYYWGDNPETSDVFIVDTHPNFKKAFGELKRKLGKPKFIYVSRRNPSTAERHERMIKLLMRQKRLTRKQAEKELGRVARSVALGNPEDVGRLYGFHYIREWDGSLNRVTVYRKRADLADWLKHGIDDWANILYNDGTMHTIPWKKFQEMDAGRFDPNVTDGSGFRYARWNSGRRAFAAKNPSAVTGNETCPIHKTKSTPWKQFGPMGFGHYGAFVCWTCREEEEKEREAKRKELDKLRGRDFYDDEEWDLNNNPARNNPMYHRNIGSTRPTFTLMWEDVGAKGKDTAVFVRDPGETREDVWKRLHNFAAKLPFPTEDMIAFDEDGFEVSMKTGKNNPRTAKRNPKEYLYIYELGGGDLYHFSVGGSSGSGYSEPVLYEVEHVVSVRDIDGDLVVQAFPGTVTIEVTRNGRKVQPYEQRGFFTRFKHPDGDWEVRLDSELESSGFKTVAKYTKKHVGRDVVNAYARRNSRRNGKPLTAQARKNTRHFAQRLHERASDLSPRNQQKLDATYAALKAQRAKTSGLHGRYAVQFGGTPGGQGNYVVVQIDNGVVTGFISVLIDQKVIMPGTSIVSAKSLGIDLRPSAGAAWRARKNGSGISTYPWLKLDVTEAFVPLMRKTKTSEVARSPRGFYTAFKKAGGKPARMGLTPAGTPSRKPYPWWQRRNEFIARHMGQVEKNGERLWKPNGDPTKRHLGLIAWAYTPDPDGVLDWLHRNRR